MAHIFVEVPDELYQRIQAAAWRANTGVAEAISTALAAAFPADVMLDARPAVSAYAHSPAGNAGTSLASSEPFAAPGGAKSQQRERFFLEWELDVPPPGSIQISDERAS